MIYSRTTNLVTITVTPFYAEDFSNPDENRFIWSYFVKITNNSDSVVQLISRHWIITDAIGRTQEVRGPGVIGYQPVLFPGESHEYDSAVDLRTESGFMEGSYLMQCVDQSRKFFEAKVPSFALDTPYVTQVLN